MNIRAGEVRVVEDGLFQVAETQARIGKCGARGVQPFRRSFQKRRPGKRRPGKSGSGKRRLSEVRIRRVQ